jgi:hypothetical protein
VATDLGLTDTALQHPDSLTHSPTDRPTSWDEILTHAKCADKPLDAAFKDSLEVVASASRTGTLSDDETTQLLEYLVSVYADRRLSGLLDEAVFSFGRKSRSRRKRSETVCPVCGRRK